MKNFLKSKLFFYILAGIIFAGSTIGVVLGIMSINKRQSNKLLVYTSFYPLYEFTKNVGGNLIEVVNLVKPGEEAHHFEPETNQLSGMMDADLIVINGAGMEGWLSKLSDNLKTKILDTSIYVDLLASDFEEHEEHEEHEEEHHHGEYDPHIWLSPKNAKKQMQAIKNKLVELDNKNAKTYEKNFKKHEILFDGLIYQFDTLLAETNLDTIVVAHQAFAYMLFDYNINQISLTGLYDENEPSINVLTETIDFIKNSNIKVIFYQSFVNSKSIDMIAENVDRTIEVEMLHTIEGLTQQQLESGENYYSLMAENLASLVYALKTA